MAGPEQAVRRAPRAPSPSKGRRLAWWVGGGLALAGLAVVGLLVLKGGKDDRLAREQAEYASAPVLSVAELVAAWRSDAKGFDAKHKGRALAVTGTLARVEAVEAAYGAGTSHVARLSGPDTLEVACWFSPANADEAATLTPGGTVTLVGRWSGEGVTSQEVVLRFCRVR